MSEATLQSATTDVAAAHQKRRCALTPSESAGQDSPTAPSVTVVVPVRNEESRLAACLARLKGFTEVVVVDSQPSAATQTITNRHGATLLEFTWDGHFPKKRNWTLRNHEFETDWVLFLDADELLTDEFNVELSESLRHTSHVGFWLNFENHFLGKKLRGGDRLRKLALFRLGAGEYEQIDEENWSTLDMEVHEHPVLKGTVGEIQAPIQHDDYRGLHHYLEKHNEYSTWEAQRYLRLIEDGQPGWEQLNPRQRSKYRYLPRWWFAPAYFLMSFIVKRGFLDGTAGFQFALMKAIYFYHVRLKIREQRDASQSVHAAKAARGAEIAQAPHQIAPK